MTPDTDYWFDPAIQPGKPRPGQLKSDFLSKEEEKTSAFINWSELSAEAKQFVKEQMGDLPDPVRFIVRFPGKVRIVGNGKPGQRKHIGSHPTLYRDFAKIDNGLALLNFTKKYGRLTEEAAGDSVHDLLDQAKLMQRLIARIAKYRRPQPAAVSDLKATVILNSRTGRIEQRVFPRTLLQALWLQFIYTPLSGTKLIECEYCHEQFWAGPGTNRRADADFCCHEHQVLFNSLKRSNPQLEKRT